MLAPCSCIRGLSWIEERCGRCVPSNWIAGRNPGIGTHYRISRYVWYQTLASSNCRATLPCAHYGRLSQFLEIWNLTPVPTSDTLARPPWFCQTIPRSRPAISGRQLVSVVGRQPNLAVPASPNCRTASAQTALDFLQTLCELRICDYEDSAHGPTSAGVPRPERSRRSHRYS